MIDDYLRSFLFVPATRPDRIGKALSSGADAIIVDLEDAVPSSEKGAARAALAEYLEQNPAARILVRVNGSDSCEFELDLALCKANTNVIGVMLPKAAKSSDVEHVVKVTQKRVWPLIETAAGIIALPDLVRSTGIARLSIGALDLASDLGLLSGTGGAEKMLDYCRCQLVIYSRVGGLAPPIESVVPTIDKPDEITRVAVNANEMGFGGMLSIHPRQLPEIHRAFTPTAAQTHWAKLVLARAYQFGAVFQLEGKMVDAPVIEEAKRILARADRT